MSNPTDSLADSEAWIQWMSSVDPAERERVAELVEAHEIDGWNGMHKLFSRLVVEVLRGTISPIVADTLTKLIDRQMAALFMEHKQANVLDAYPASAGGALFELERTILKSTPLQPRYLEKKDDLDVNVLDAFDEEIPKIKVERE